MTTPNHRRPPGPRPGLPDELAFFSLWLRRPRRLGAVVPSGRALADAMAGQIDVAAPGEVVELGGGTGSVTRAILDAGVAPKDLIVVERETALCRTIAARFPGVRVAHGDARDLRRLLEAVGAARIKTVISSLPLLAMERDDCRRILESAFAVLDKRGDFVQFTYGPASPVSGRTRATLGVIGERTDWVLRNLPPAAVWRYRRAADKPALRSAA
jgi:phosphatidylethanolamine/phosphatidyl-N-methylethanolamine N-methyltransferase